MASSNFFKIAQKTAFAKGLLNTAGEVIQHLFIIDLYTSELVIYRCR